MNTNCPNDARHDRTPASILDHPTYLDPASMNGSNFECFPPQPPVSVLTSCEKSESFLLMQILFCVCSHQQQTLGSGCCSIGTPFESNTLGETETPQPRFNNFISSLVLSLHCFFIAWWWRHLTGKQGSWPAFVIAQMT